MKMMMKLAFVKSNVKLTATILSVATLIESCETEPSCSSSITNSTNNVKNSQLDENHPTLAKQDMRRFHLVEIRIPKKFSEEQIENFFGILISMRLQKA